MIKALIYAGTLQQAEFLAKREGLLFKEYRYMYSKQSIIGMDRSIPCWLYGTYRSRYDWYEFEMILNHNLREVVRMGD
jgi:hypothetical protein